MSYRIESTHPIVGPLVHGQHHTVLYVDNRATAIVMAAKSYTLPYGKEIRVVHIQSGEVVYRKTASTAEPALDT